MKNNILYQKVEKFIFKQNERIIVDYTYAARYIASKIFNNPQMKNKIEDILCDHGYSSEVSMKIIDILKS